MRSRRCRILGLATPWRNYLHEVVLEVMIGDGGRVLEGSEGVLIGRRRSLRPVVRSGMVVSRSSRPIAFESAGQSPEGAGRGWFTEFLVACASEELSA
jgi:hypothetical protein